VKVSKRRVKKEKTKGINKFKRGKGEKDERERERERERGLKKKHLQSFSFDATKITIIKQAQSFFTLAKQEFIKYVKL
jgi:hypothetical protein